MQNSSKTSCRGLAILAALFFIPATGLAVTDFSFFSEIQYNDNLSRTDRRWSGERGDVGLRSVFRAETGDVLENDFRVAAALEAGVETWWETSGLNAFKPAADVAITRRFGMGPTAPYLRADVVGGHAFYGEAFRDGLFWEAGLAGGIRFNERFAAEAGYRFEEQHARDSFFEHDGHTFFAEAEIAATPRIPILAGYSFRRGIVHSYTAMDQGLTESRRNMQNTFENLAWVYRTRLNSHTVSAGIAPDLTETASLQLLYSFQHSRGSGFRYNNNIVSATLFFLF